MKKSKYHVRYTFQYYFGEYPYCKLSSKKLDFCHFLYYKNLCCGFEFILSVNVVRITPNLYEINKPII